MVKRWPFPEEGHVGSDAGFGNAQDAPLSCAYPSWVRVQIRGKIGRAALDQIHAIDETRLVKKLGEVPETTADDIAAVLVEMFRRP